MTAETLAPALLVTGFAWVVLGLLHSVLGEMKVLRPLFAAREWKLRVLPRRSAETLLRFAWHATSITWFGLAAIAFGLSLHLSLTVVALAMGGCLFWALRGHLAWPVFLVAGLGAVWSTGLLDRVAQPVALSTAIVLTGLALVHLYWALGGRRALSSALPSRSDGGVVFRPGRVITFGVAASLMLFAALIVQTLRIDGGYPRALVGIGILILVARAVGDGRYLGFTKRIRGTRFAQLDDRYFTPVVVFLALGSVAALLA